MILPLLTSTLDRHTWGSFCHFYNMTSRKSKKASNMGLANNKERGKSPKLSAYQQAQGSVASTVAVSHGTISSGLHLTSEGSASPEVASSSEESIFPPSTTSSDTRSSRNATLVAELEAALEQGDSSEETASPRRNNPSDGSSVDSGQSKYPQGFEIRSSNTPESLSDLENTLMPSAEKYDSSADDLIITESAQALIRPESGMMIENLSCQSHPDGNKDMLHGSDESEHSDYECSGCLENSGPRGCFQSNETMDITPEVNQRSSNDTLIRTLLQVSKLSSDLVLLGHTDTPNNSVAKSSSLVRLPFHGTHLSNKLIVAGPLLVPPKHQGHLPGRSPWWSSILQSTFNLPQAST